MRVERVCLCVLGVIVLLGALIVIPTQLFSVITIFKGSSTHINSVFHIKSKIFTHILVKIHVITVTYTP